ncbi:MAG: hypothetical protein ACHQF2_11290, partial [Flavobacteriales bacterium]
MEEILKYKWAFIGTIGLHILLVLSFDQVRFKAKFEPLELVEMPVMLEPEPPKKIIVSADADELTESEKISNRTFNEADKMGQTNETYDSRKFSNVNEKADEDVKNFEKQAFEEMKNNRINKYGEYDPNKNKKTTENQKDKSVTEENNTNTNVNSSNRTMGTSRVAASYDLDGRRDEYFAKPSYICRGSGNVVLKIKVNRSGKVIAADVDTDVSTY